MSRCRPGASMLSIGLAVALVTGAGGGTSGSRHKSATSATMPAGPGCIRPDSGHGCLPVAPASKRVDLVRPSFSHPVPITNPLHPTSEVAQVIFGGQVDGKPFRTEFTLLPDRKAINWDGRRIDAVTTQYLAYEDGRIQELAYDRFAQADDGAVWYLGEDVSDYRNGVAYTHEGSWQAGRDGPGAMIMPAHHRVGDVYRTENAPPIVFEEITVKAVGRTVPGPSGPVRGALVVSELHTDGTREDKIFAPGYGEFSTGDAKGDLEAVSLAVPTDARPRPLPAQLSALSAAVRKAFDTVGRNDWAGAATAGTTLREAWDAYRSGDLPPLLERQTSRDVDLLARAVAARTPSQAHQAALRVAQDDLDLRLRHRPLAEVELARLDLWGRQLLVDAVASDRGAVAGDATTMQLIWQRVRHGADPAAAARVDARLRDLRAAAGNRDVAAAAGAVPALLATVATVRPG